MAEDLQLYTFKMIEPDGTETVKGYAYGEPWVSWALFMDDICFKTPEAAKEWWENNYG